MKILTSNRDVILGGAVVLLLVILLGFIAAVIRREFAMGKSLVRLDQIAAPLDGWASNGRRNHHAHVTLTFPGARRRLSDADIPRIVEVVRAAHDENLWEQIHLDLNGQNITDEGLRLLTTNDVELGTLYLTSNLLTEAAVIRVRVEHPDWEIHWQPRAAEEMVKSGGNSTASP